MIQAFVLHAFAEMGKYFIGQSLEVERRQRCDWSRLNAFDENGVKNCIVETIAVTAWKEQVPEDSVRSPWGFSPGTPCWSAHNSWNVCQAKINNSQSGWNTYQVKIKIQYSDSCSLFLKLLNRYSLLIYKEQLQSLSNTNQTWKYRVHLLLWKVWS